MWKVFASLFSKSDRPSNARSVGRLRRGEISFSAFLFCQAFFLRLLCQRKKRISNLKRLCAERGTPHLCGSPLPSHRLGIHPSVALSNDKEFRSLRRATADLGGSGKPLKRLVRNFQIGFATKSPLNRNFPHSKNFFKKILKFSRICNTFVTRQVL